MDAVNLEKLYRTFDNCKVSFSILKSLSNISFIIESNDSKIGYLILHSRQNENVFNEEWCNEMNILIQYIVCVKYI